MNDDLADYEDRTLPTQSAPLSTAYFNDFLLKDELNMSLKENNFEHPSEVQQLIIPKAILGVDILSQAKSGTGKTVVFVLSVLQQLKSNALSVVVLVHTKEMAIQIKKEFERFVKFLEEKVTVMEFFGGVDVESDLQRLGIYNNNSDSRSRSFYGNTGNRTESIGTNNIQRTGSSNNNLNNSTESRTGDKVYIDARSYSLEQPTKETHNYSQRFSSKRTETKEENNTQSTTPTIFIGTPGRTLDLLRRKAIDFSTVKHFIIDEVDEMLVDLNNRLTIQDIFFHTPVNKQTMLFTATLTPEIKETCLLFLKNPHVVIIDEEKKLTLHGLIQYYVNCPPENTSLNKHSKKFKLLEAIIDNTEFNQLVIFTKNKYTCVTLTRLLREIEFPAIDIYGNLDVKTRLEKFNRFKNLKERILVTTNLMARGIDVADVNLVINYDMAECAETYLHRVGRAGRFETKGMAISLIETSEDKAVLNDVQSRFEVSIKEMDIKSN